MLDNEGNRARLLMCRVESFNGGGVGGGRAFAMAKGSGKHTFVPLRQGCTVTVLPRLVHRDDLEDSSNLDAPENLLGIRAYIDSRF